MRKIPIVLVSLLLTACVDDTASYYVDGGGGSHALTVRRVQEHFWKRNAAVALVLARWPDCQRRIELGTMPANDIEIELYAVGDNVWTLREGKQLWQVDTQTCTELAEPQTEAGELQGVFRVEGGKLVFVPAVAAAQDGAPGPGMEGAENSGGGQVSTTQ